MEEGDKLTLVVAQKRERGEKISFGTLNTLAGELDSYTEKIIIDLIEALVQW